MPVSLDQHLLMRWSASTAVETGERKRHCSASGVAQELAAGLKTEVRSLLAGAGVDKFVMKPVKRSYAFELDAIPAGEQWVLKLRYSAAKPSLPLGLTGVTLPPLF